MGRGCAAQAKEILPGIDYKLGELLRKYGNRPLRLAALPDGSHLGTFPVKNHWKDNADLALIERSAHQLVELADRFGYSAIFLPRPGAGAGGLHYDKQVKPVIEEILLGDRFAIVTYLELPDQEEPDMLKTILKLKRIRGDVRAASRGPQALGKRLTERSIHRLVHKLFR